MKRTEKTIEVDKKILEMLLNGKSYTTIQAELNVSPARIVVVKKTNAPKFMSSTNDALLGTTTITPITLTSEEKITPTMTTLGRKKPAFTTTTPEENTTPIITTPGENTTPIITTPGENTTPIITTPGKIIITQEEDNIGYITSCEKRQSEVKLVDPHATEIKYMKRYLNLVGKTKTRKEILDFLNELQNSIRKQEIRKTSPFAKYIMRLQNNLIKAYEFGSKTVCFEMSKSDISHYKKIIGFWDSLAL